MLLVYPIKPCLVAIPLPLSPTNALITGADLDFADLDPDEDLADLDFFANLEQPSPSSGGEASVAYWVYVVSGS